MIAEQSVMEHAGLVRRFAYRYHRRIGKAALLELDDLMQYGYIGLIKGLHNFDPELGFQPSTYFSAMIVGEIRRAIRDRLCALKVHRDDSAARSQYRYVESLNRPVVDGDDNTQLGNLIGRWTDMSHFEIKDWLERELTEREIKVIRLRLAGLSQRQIAEKFGVKQVAVSRWLARIKHKLKGELENA